MRSQIPLLRLERNMLWSLDFLHRIKARVESGNITIITPMLSKVEFF
jgi:hypothetical protein